VRFYFRALASARLDTFSGWLLGGLAAATTLWSSQFDSAAKHLSLEAIRCCLFLFLLSVAVALIEKYLSSVILAGSAGAAVGREMVSKAPFNAGNLNIEVIFSEIARTYVSTG
jgi:hypothetical protein